MTAGISKRDYFLFSLPIGLQVLLQNLVGITDNLMVGSMGPKFMAALTVASRYYFFLNILIMALISSVSIISSQAWGRKEISKFKRINGSAIAVILPFALLLAVLMFIFSDLLISLMTTDVLVKELALGYFKILSLVIIASCINIIFAGIFISSGETKLPFFQQLITTGINILLNYGLIYGELGLPELGVKGAAIASLISVMVGNFILMFFLIKSGKAPELKSILHPAQDEIKKLISIGLPILGDGMVWQVSTIFYVKLISDFGSDSVATYGVAGIYMMIQSILVMGFINGAGIQTGHLLGAGDRTLAFSFSRMSLSFTFLISIGINFILVGVSPFIPSLFKFPPETTRICTIVLILMTVKHLFQTICGHLSAIIRAGEETRPLFHMSLGSFLFLGLPLALLFGPILQKGIIGITIAFTIEEAGKALITYFIYRKKNWLKNVSFIEENVLVNS